MEVGDSLLYVKELQTSAPAIVPALCVIMMISHSFSFMSYCVWISPPPLSVDDEWVNNSYLQFKDALVGPFGHFLRVWWSNPVWLCPTPTAAKWEKQVTNYNAIVLTTYVLYVSILIQPTSPWNYSRREKEVRAQMIWFNCWHYQPQNRKFKKPETATLILCVYSL